MEQRAELVEHARGVLRGESVLRVGVRDAEEDCPGAGGDVLCGSHCVVHLPTRTAWQARPDAALERGDVEVGRWVDHPARRATDCSTTSLQRSKRRSTNARSVGSTSPPSASISSSTTRFSRRDRSAGGERRRQRVDRVADQHGAPRCHGGSTRIASTGRRTTCSGSTIRSRTLAGEAAEAGEQLAISAGRPRRHAVELGARAGTAEHVHLRVGTGHRPTSCAERCTGGSGARGGEPRQSTSRAACRRVVVLSRSSGAGRGDGVDEPERRESADRGAAGRCRARSTTRAWLSMQCGP